MHQPLGMRVYLTALAMFPQSYLDCAGECIRRALRPFDKDDAVRHGFRKAELLQFLRMRQTVKIEMVYRDAQRVALHECEGRARHFQLAIPRDRADCGPGERRFAGAKVAVKSDYIALAKRKGEILAQQRACRFVG